MPASCAVYFPRRKLNNKASTKKGTWWTCMYNYKYIYMFEEHLDIVKIPKDCNKYFHCVKLEAYHCSIWVYTLYMPNIHRTQYISTFPVFHFHLFLRFIRHFKHPTPPFFSSWNFIPSRLLSLQEKSSKGCDNQLAVPPLSTDGSKSQRSKLVFEDR